MINLTESSASNVVLTLSEHSTLATTYFLFVIYGNDKGVVKTFTAPNISTSTNRYDEFVITLNSTENLTTGTIDLNQGFYSYEVYSTAVQNDLDIANVTELLEVGNVFVSGDDLITDSTYIKDSNRKTVYNG